MNVTGLPKCARATPEHRPAPAPRLTVDEIRQRWGIDCEDVTDERATDPVDDGPALTVFNPDGLARPARRQHETQPQE